VHKLRKILALFFGALSIFFAGIAVHKHFTLKDTTIDSQNLHDWGHELETQARQQDKLIFFFVNPESFEKTKLLDDNFLMSHLDKNAFPADFRAIAFIYGNAGQSEKIAYGILTPKMFPLLVSAKLPEQDSPRSPSLATVLKASLKLHQNEREKLNLIANQSQIENKEAPVFVPLNTNNLAENAELFQFFATRNLESVPSAIVSENAKLLFRKCKTKYRDNFAINALPLAVRHLVAGINSENSDFTRKILFAQALAECAILLKEKNALAASENFAKHLYSIQREDGAFEDNNLVFLSQNALILSLLSLNYKILPNERSLESLTKCENFVHKNFLSKRVLPAMLSKKSESGATEYGILSCAYFDMFLILKDEDYFKKSLFLISKLNDNFLDESGLYKEMAKDSVLAKYVKLYSNKDNILPSASGSVSQVLANMQTIKPNEKQAKTLALMQTKHKANNIFNSLDKASIKLSSYTCPLIDIVQPNKPMNEINTFNQ